MAQVAECRFCDSDNAWINLVKHKCIFRLFRLRAAIGRDPDGAFLRTVIEGDQRGMAVEYDPDTPGAYIWARKAEELAERVWDQAGVKILERSRV